MKLLVKRYVLENAIRYKGKASINAVMGKVLAENPKLKAKVREVKEIIERVVKEINLWPVEKQIKELKKIAPKPVKLHKGKKKGLPKLPKVEGKVIMRFEPSPSGPLHVGHAYVLSLNSEYCKRYKGELILRIGDTNPENIYERAYEMIKEEAMWLTKNNIKRVIIQSDRLEIYYRYMERLIELGKGYVCLCKPDDYKRLILRQKACPCRGLEPEEQMKRWKKMFNKYKQGEAVARIKTNLKHKNPAMRDFPVFRINRTKHPRHPEYRVWPLMNMAVAVDDIELKITHVIRAKDHYDNAKRQEYIYRYLNKPIPVALFVGRINFVGMNVSCSKTRPLIENGTYKGWDDIRLPFLSALRRRGYQPEAFIKYAIEVGLSLTDKTVTKEEFFKTINAFNKEIIDAKANRYFFIENPVKIKIEGAPKQIVELDLHPDYRKGGRVFVTKDEFFVTKQDYESFEDGKLYRLMDCLNFVKQGSKFVFDSLDYGKYKAIGEKIVHWLPKDKNLVKVAVLMDDGKFRYGLGEERMDNIKEGEIVQLERFGFARLDSKADKLVFWFTHK